MCSQLLKSVRLYIPSIAAIILSSNIAMANKNYDAGHVTPLRQVADLIDNQI
ncbi:MAG: Hsp20/alpha crystallin family protein, partial [Rickettsia endosymbiont of Ixodes persulcatus]|nr:Hsp20/alpha crystallin family protein [Rickettsia endosymbiont of Ixodes persulcatus]